MPEREYLPERVSVGPAPWRLALIAAGVVVALDQVSKAIVRASVGRGETVKFFLGIDLANVRNKGVAFGVLARGGGVVAALTGLALVAIVGYFVVRSQTPLLWLPVGMLLGGALGNLADRARDGAVTDFIDPVLWPAFNLADMSIVLGVLGLLYVIEGPGSG